MHAFILTKNREAVRVKTTRERQAQLDVSAKATGGGVPADVAGASSAVLHRSEANGEDFGL